MIKRRGKKLSYIPERSAPLALTYHVAPKHHCSGKCGTDFGICRETTYNNGMCLDPAARERIIELVRDHG